MSLLLYVSLCVSAVTLSVCLSLSLSLSLSLLCLSDLPGEEDKGAKMLGLRGSGRGLGGLRGRQGGREGEGERVWSHTWRQSMFLCHVCVCHVYVCHVCVSCVCACLNQGLLGNCFPLSDYTDTQRHRDRETGRLRDRETDTERQTQRDTRDRDTERRERDRRETERRHRKERHREERERQKSVTCFLQSRVCGDTGWAQRERETERRGHREGGTQREAHREEREGAQRETRTEREAQREIIYTCTDVSLSVSLCVSCESRVCHVSVCVSVCVVCHVSLCEPCRGRARMYLFLSAACWTGREGGLREIVGLSIRLREG